MSEWMFFQSPEEWRDALNELLTRFGASIVGGRLYESPHVSPFSGALPDTDIDALFPSGILYILPPIGTSLVLERVGNLDRFKISDIKGGPFSALSLSMLWQRPQRSLLKPAILSRRAEFWDRDLKRRFPISDDFRRWHEDLKKFFQKKLLRIGPVWISERAVQLVQSDAAVLNLDTTEAARFSAALKEHGA